MSKIKFAIRDASNLNFVNDFSKSCLINDYHYSKISYFLYTYNYSKRLYYLDQNNCRELVCSVIKRKFSNGSIKSVNDLIMFITLDKSTRADAAMLDGFNLINIVESHLCWSKSSFIKYKNNENKYKNIYKLNLNSRWLRAPQLLSLALLFIKINVIRPLPGNIKCIDDIVNANTTRTEHKELTLEVKSLLKTIINNVEYLFFQRSAKYNFLRSSIHDGILTLASWTKDYLPSDIVCMYETQDRNHFQKNIRPMSNRELLIKLRKIVHGTENFSSVKVD